MRSAIFSLIPSAKRGGSTVASSWIAIWLRDLLEIPLYEDDKILEEGSLDCLFIVNGSTLYCKHLPAIGQAVRDAKRVIWVQNDYTLPPPLPESDAISPFRRAFADRKLVPDYWTTCENNVHKTPGSRWVNWNVLGYKVGLTRAPLGHRHGLYYGAHRDGRVSAFEAIYAAFAGKPLHISSTSAQFPDALRIAPFRADFYGSIRKYGVGIYCQDEKSIEGRTSPATRFYEMLSVGLPMVFLPDCVGTLAHYGYDVSEYVLTPDTCFDLIEKRREIADEQQAWVKDFEGELATQVRYLYDRL